jgi:zinc/manganese transport system permease protein
VLPMLVTLALLGVWFTRGRALGARAFYLLFAVAVTVSVQLVGVYLVFASLIVPSLGARDWPEPRRLPLAYAIGAGGYAIGLVLSAAFDLPSGALIVWCLAALAVLAHAAAPARARSAA